MLFQQVHIKGDMSLLGANSLAQLAELPCLAASLAVAL